MADHEVRDGGRTLQFDGELIAESTSRRQGQGRWIEFSLYRTRAGSYILSRVGQTVVFHDAACELVPQYRLKPGTVDPEAWPCEYCKPFYGDADVCPERVRYWAQVIDRPGGVVEALTRYDDSGARYLTFVAQRLLADASEVDEGIMKAYTVEHVA